jgi:CheY-like chemotaxis protein
VIAPHQIFVVDDDEDIREGLMDFLEDHGYDPVGAADGREALQLLGTSGSRPCIIILDLMMPVMDGRSFREAQLQDPNLSEIPVVVISAYKDGDDTARQINALTYLPKPLDLNALLAVVKAHCIPN